MDVIGDVDVPAMRAVDEVRKAQEQAERGRILGTAAWASLLMLVVLGFLVAAKHTELERSLGQWRWYGPANIVVALTLITLGLLTRSYFHLWESHNWKSRLLSHLQDADQQARISLLARDRFISVFRPSCGDVERKLIEAAYDVLKVHERQVKFYAEGTGDYSKQRVHLDPEEEARRLKLAFDAAQEDLKRDMAGALHRFRYLRTIASAHEYRVFDSWKDYIPTEVLPKQLKRSMPGPVFQTQPGEGDAGLPISPELREKQRCTEFPDPSGPQHAD